VLEEDQVGVKEEVARPEIRSLQRRGLLLLRLWVGKLLVQ